MASAVIGAAFNARAGSSSTPSAAGSNQLTTRSAQPYVDVNRDANLARGFYVAAAVLAAAGGGLLWWDLQVDSIGVTTHF